MCMLPNTMYKFQAKRSGTPVLPAEMLRMTRKVLSNILFL